MIKQFEIKNKILEEDLIITRVKFTNYYKVLIKGKKSKMKIFKKFDDFDDLLEKFITLAIRNAYLENKIELLKRGVKNEYSKF